MIKFRIPLSVEIRCKQRHEIRMLAVPIFCCCLFSRPQLLYAICTFFSNAVCAFIILSRRRSTMQGKTNLLNLAGDMSWMLSIWRMASLPFFFFVLLSSIKKCATADHHIFFACCRTQCFQAFPIVVS